LAHTSLAHFVVSPARISRTLSLFAIASIKLDRYQWWSKSWFQRSREAFRFFRFRSPVLVLVMLSATRSEALSPTFHTKVGSPLRSARAACVSVYTRAARFLVETFATQLAKP
jgi:hypothetical protein